MSAIDVLVVDDDFRVAGLHYDIVNAQPGFTARTPEHTLGAARRSVASAPPDLMLVDVYLPDGDGVEFIRSAAIDAFALSAATDAATFRRALRAGALGYLIKPFDALTLQACLERYARFRNLTDGVRTLTQDDLDRALGILHSPGETASVSRSATEQLIISALAQGEASAGQVAEVAGISRATAQRHLSALAQRGTIEVRLRYGSTGRPEHRYRAAITR